MDELSQLAAMAKRHRQRMAPVATPRKDRVILPRDLRDKIGPELRRKRLVIIRRELARGASYTVADATARRQLRTKYAGLCSKHDRIDMRQTAALIRSSVADAFENCSMRPLHDAYTDGVADALRCALEPFAQLGLSANASISY
jgi:hypothetical protein